MSRSDSSALEHELAALAPRGRTNLVDRVVAHWATVRSPVGDLYVCWTVEGICAVGAKATVKSARAFVDQVRDQIGRPVVSDAPVPAAVVDAAMTGRSRPLRFDFGGLTPFEVDVLEATRRIPAGEVRPYAWVAAEIGRPRAVRAVGSALGRNPVPFLIPCHRVTRSDGSIGNYGGGPKMKEELLRAEKANIDEIAELAGRRVHFVGCTTTKIVCLPSCGSVRRVGLTRRAEFRDLDDALALGYRPCERCRPGFAASA